MALHRLVFDATDADTRAASANVGAYLRSSDGTLLTHTDVGGKKALDVRVAEGINVEVDLDAADDSVAAWLSDGAGNAIGSTGGALHISDAGGSITVDGSVTVSATDLDIRDLDASQDNVAISDGTDTLAINADGSINITDNGGSITVDGTVTANQGTSPWVVGDGGGSLTVDAIDLDIRDLTAASDSVSSWVKDGTGTAITSTAESGDQALDVHISNASITTSDSALADSALLAVAETVGVAAAQIVDGADELASRKYLYLYNNGNRVAYVGQSGITTATGFPLPPGSILEARIGAAVDVYMIADAAGQNIRTLQLS